MAVLEPPVLSMLEIRLSAALDRIHEMALQREPRGELVVAHRPIWEQKPHNMICLYLVSTLPTWL